MTRQFYDEYTAAEVFFLWLKFPEKLVSYCCYLTSDEHSQLQKIFKLFLIEYRLHVEDFDAYSFYSSIVNMRHVLDPVC